MHSVSFTSDKRDSIAKNSKAWIYKLQQYWQRPFNFYTQFRRREHAFYKKAFNCTAKTKCRNWNFETENLKQIFPAKEYWAISQNFHIHGSGLWANYIFPRWVCLFCWRKYVDWSWEYINRSQTHECGNWGWGRAIPRKGIYERNCRCSVMDKLKLNESLHSLKVYWRLHWRKCTANR